jgi:hypothetical protein
MSYGWMDNGAINQMRRLFIWASVLMPIVVITIGGYIYFQGWNWKLAILLVVSGGIGEYLVLKELNK